MSMRSGAPRLVEPARSPQGRAVPASARRHLGKRSAAQDGAKHLECALRITGVEPAQAGLRPEPGPLPLRVAPRRDRDAFARGGLVELAREQGADLAVTDRLQRAQLTRVPGAQQIAHLVDE